VISSHGKDNVFGSRLRKLRNDTKLTAKKLGEKFGLAESTISGYENGNRTPDVQLICKFADFFGVTTDYLLGRTDNPNTCHQLCDQIKSLPPEAWEELQNYLDYLAHKYRPVKK